METKNRKATRFKEYDYSCDGVYFLTICSKDKKPIFSKIVVDENITASRDFVGDGVLDVPKVVLFKHGKIIRKYLEQIGNHYDYLNIDKYVVMPNHIHILLSVSNCGTSRTPSPTNNTISAFVSTFKRFVNKEIGENIFQRSFHDHIIRNGQDYIEHYSYIENNPAKWEFDELYII